MIISLLGGFCPVPTNINKTNNNISPQTIEHKKTMSCGVVNPGLLGCESIISPDKNSRWQHNISRSYSDFLLISNSPDNIEEI
jgi:hypothetical protein